MEFNFLIIAIAALVPLIMGFIWYHPKVFGTAWMNSLGMTEESMKGANMAKIFIVTYILSFLIAFSVQFFVIHQFSFISILVDEPGFGDPTSEIGMYFTDFMNKYGNNYRTFQHGVLHGFMTGLFLLMPIIGINALFERRNFKYTAINSGFWIVCVAIMGGIICQWV